MDFLEKLLVGRQLSQTATDYFSAEYDRHIAIVALPLIMASFVLALLEYQIPLAWIWFGLIVGFQLARALIVKQASKTNPLQYKVLFELFGYSTSILLVLYLFLFGWQSLDESKIVYNCFFVYTTTVFHLEILRYSLFKLVAHSFITCLGLVVYLTLFTQLGYDEKLIYALTVCLGFVMLIYFGRSSHLIVLDAYDLLAQNQRLVTKMDQMLVLDELTQQYNRRYFNMQLSKHIERYRRHQAYFSLAIVDIDFFKSVNDSFGHDIGDEVLIVVASFIRKQMRSTDILTRYGGEEFALILPFTEQKVAKKVLDKLRNSFAEHQFVVNGINFSITISIGVTEVRSADEEEAIIKRADAALYQAKRNGRNRVEALSDITRISNHHLKMS